MNPAKRKKLYRAKLAEQNGLVELPPVEQKVEVVEPVVVTTQEVPAEKQDVKLGLKELPKEEPVPVAEQTSETVVEPVVTTGKKKKS